MSESQVVKFAQNNLHGMKVCSQGRICKNDVSTTVAYLESVIEDQKALLEKAVKFKSIYDISDQQFAVWAGEAESLIELDHDLSSQNFIRNNDKELIIEKNKAPVLKLVK